MENGMEDGTAIMVWNMEVAGMEWKTIFHTAIPIPIPANSILDFARGIYKKIYTDTDN